MIMTWFGVNYYLSGLHSYGKTEGGDLLLWIWGAGLCVVLALEMCIRDSVRTGWKETFGAVKNKERCYAFGYLV